MLIKKLWKREKIKKYDTGMFVVGCGLLFLFLFLAFIVFGFVRINVHRNLSDHYFQISKFYYNNMPEKKQGDVGRICRQISKSESRIFWDVRIWTIKQGIEDKELYDYAYNLYMIEQKKQQEKGEKKIEIYKKDSKSFQDRLFHKKGEK